MAVSLFMTMFVGNNKTNDMEILKTQKVEATEFTDEASIKTLSRAPKQAEEKVLFEDDDSIILEF